MAEVNPTTVDPVTVSVVQHRLRAIVEEMGEAMLRTSYSQILNSSRDFSTALSDPNGRLIAQAEHVPIHVGALPWAVKAVHEFFKGRIHPGDVYLLNDPYWGGNHLPDLTAFVPVFDGDRLAFWSINRSHQSAIGGATPGGHTPGATEIWHEGIRVPPLRLYDRGKLLDDVNEMLVLNVRHPRDFRGDLAAMIGSARIGERRLQALLAEFGSATTHTAIEAVLDGAERQVRAVISQWPDGVYFGEAMIDDDGHRFKDIHIRAKVTKRGSDLEVNLADCHPEVDGFINSAYPNTRSAVVVALSYLIDPATPKNDGAFRPVSVITREGTIVHPLPGKPVSGSFTAAALAKTVERFHQMHEELHTYASRDQEPILRGLRVKAVAVEDKPSLPKRRRTAARAKRVGTRRAFFDGAFVATPLYAGPALLPGQRLRGPAIVEEPFTTIVVYPGQRATVDPHGNYVIERGRG
jgi:N-methylhydantoinase B